jgi:hypothetical protein
MPTTTTKKATTTTTTKKKPVAAPSIDLQPNPFVFEVFDLILKQRTKPKKIEVIQKYRDDGIIAVWLWNYTNLQSALPPGEVPYAGLEELNAGNDTLSATIGKQVKSTEPVDTYGSNNRTTIRNEFQNFYNFIRGGNDSLSSIRRETMFINLVQGLHPREAEILILTKDKKLTDRYPIPFELIREALPDVVWDR